ncbi:hypothetical protein SAMN05518872_1262 [Psychrobacillus sp. OK032]|nr:hypothetical protein SAMN05518872_1262 [Psychrobacillus sp. OK032]
MRKSGLIKLQKMADPLSLTGALVKERWVARGNSFLFDLRSKLVEEKIIIVGR